jgi:hypothetical protein
MSPATKISPVARRPLRNGAHGIRIEKVDISPEKALEWLATNDGNRAVSMSRVQQLARDMTDGVFELTHQGIAFDSEGRLIDGQHRLWAIVESKKTVTMFVCWGLKRQEVSHYIDDGRPRSMADKLGYSGIDTNKRRVSIVRSMLLHYRTQLAAPAGDVYTWGGRGERVRTSTFAEFHEKVRPAIDFAIGTAANGKFGHACVCAAVACAWFTQDHARLDQFQKILATGEIASRTDNAAIRLRDFLMNSGLTSGGESARCEIFVRASTALRAFLEGRSLAKLYAVPTSPFTIPSFPGITLD